MMVSRIGYRLGFLAALVLAGICLSSCGGGGGHGTGSAGPGLVGAVFGYNDAPARGVPVSLDPPGGPGGIQVGPDGRFFLTPVGPGRHVLRVGDSVATATFFISVTAVQGASFLPRPIFLPSLESGISESVPTISPTATLIRGTKLDGVSLLIASNTGVTYPVNNTTPVVTIVGVAPSRLPVALPNGLAAKAAYAIEPRGLRFSVGAQLTLPRLESFSAGPWDLWKLDDTGTWQVLAPIATVGSSGLTAVVDEGTLYAAVPRSIPQTVTLTGRVVSGARPIAGYQVECWNQVSGVTKADGLFTITKVPTSFNGFLLRSSPAHPGVEFAAEVNTQGASAGLTDVGDVIVGAPPPFGVRPKVLSTQPPDGTANVPVQTQVSVQFNEAVDPTSVALSLHGLRGTETGQLFLSNAFTAVFVPSTNLVPGDTYSLVVDPDVKDLAGNTIDPSHLLFRFKTDAVTVPPPPPVDQRIFGLSPLTATSSTLVTLFGRNFPGGSSVKVGASTALVQRETATTIQFFPPVMEPASDAAVAVVNSAQTTVTALGPLVLDLRSSVASLSSPTVVRAMPPANLFVVGQNVAAGTVTVDGISIASVDSTELFGGQPAVVSKQAALGVNVTPSIFTGPVQVRGPNGKPGGTYRFVHVSDAP